MKHFTLALLLVLGCSDPESSPPTGPGPDACPEGGWASAEDCGEFTECADGEYEQVAGTDTSDRVCAALTDCGAAQFEATAPTPTSDRACADLTVCGDEQYEATAPTATSDRGCESLTPCLDGQVEIAPATATSDRVCEDDPGPDLAALTNGIDTLNTADYPGSIIVHERAFSIGALGNGTSFLAGGRLGDGRVIGYGKDGFLNGGWQSRGLNHRRFAINAALWTGRSADPVVAVAPGYENLRSALEGERIEVVDWEAGAPPDDVDVVVARSGTQWEDADLTALREWVRGGGGLILEGNPWAYDSGVDFVHRYPGNALLNEAGITWTHDYTWPDWGDVPVGAEPRSLQNALVALRHLIAHLRDGAPTTEAETAEASQVIRRAAGVLTADFETFWALVLELTALLSVEPPTEDTPFDPSTDPLGWLALELDVARTQTAAPADLGAHPQAEDFPGAVPEGERVTRTLTLDGDNDGWPAQRIYSNPGSATWRSTALYAAPGEVLEVAVSEEVAAAGVGVRIGAHTDRLGEGHTQRRFPVLSRWYALQTGVTPVANAFGGLVYITLPEGVRLGEFEVTIAGAVEAPLYVRGETTNEDWIAIRDRPAPWAELRTDHLIWTVPSAAIRTLDDPTYVMDFWHEVIEHADDLAGVDRVHERAERIVTDRQISAGYMHSGYPIMGHLDQAERFQDIETMLEEGNWGPFHELGHNFQWRDWLLPGTTETSCNLWSMYISGHLTGDEYAHEAIAPEARAERLRGYVDGGRDFWGSWSVWTALEFYMQLREAFGWEPFTQVFTEYRLMTEEERPADNDRARINEFLVRFSTVIEMDLGPYFLAWGMPVSDTALAAAGRFPEWTGYAEALRD